ncbi:uncharacterized protein B0H64DRAFT_316445 [Chaetomium fimeti]|uniref:Uncharacterized protein n=1 Tax=Chaetomium fimeti TaxID=1854472 RepID=A0AAE0HLJ4_9PEZI|nr:hypothetical protein B0H64DRAFT_316445 [Chaetomium fimeti]
MPPRRKRTYLATNLHNGKPMPSKRRRVADIVTLSSDSESDAFETDQRYHPIVLDDDNEEEDNEEENNEKDCQWGYEDDDESQESQYHRSRSLIEQLQKDAFDDFKADVCLELDCLRESTEKAANPLPVEDDDAPGLRDVLREWVEQDKASRRTNHLYYRLDHTYNDGQFPPEAFLGRDAVVVETLNRMADELHLEIFLALVEREDRGPTPDYLVRTLVDQHGHELISDIPVDDNLVQAKVPSLLAGAVGSEVAVMLAPRDSVVDFLMRYTTIPSTSTLCPSRLKLLEGVARYFITRISESSSCDPLVAVFREFCATVWRLDEAKGLSVLSDLVVHDLLQAVVNMEDWDFLEQAACRLGKRPPLSFFTISTLLADGADSVVASFAFKVVADVGLIPRPEFTSFWIPFLGHLIKVLEEKNVFLSASRYRHFFAAILETYLARCVGALPFTWMPKTKEIDCRCSLCTSFRRFLINSVSAASFHSGSQLNVHHLNTYLIPNAYKNNRCILGMEDGSLVVRKMEEVDVQNRERWMESNKTASMNIRKLDGPSLRQILGDDYPRIRNFQSVQKPKRCSPVPIESLSDPLHQADILRPHQIPVSMAPAASPGSAHRLLGSSRSPNRQGRLPSTNSPLAAAPGRPVRSTARTPRNPAKGNGNHNPDETLTSATSRMDGFLAGCRSQPAASNPRLSPPITPAAYREAISRGWDSVRSKETESYTSRAESVWGVTRPTPVSMSKYLPRSTPKASPRGTPFSSQPTAFQSSPSSPSKRARSGNASKGARLPVPAPTPRRSAATMQPSSPSPRVFGPVSSGRLNSIPTSRTASKAKTEVVKVKTEVLPSASSSRGAKKRVCEVIDLTGDD